MKTKENKVQTPPTGQSKTNLDIENITVIDEIAVAPIATKFQTVMDILQENPKLKPVQKAYLKMRDSLQEFEKIESKINFHVLESAFIKNLKPTNFNFKLCNGDTVLHTIHKDDHVEKHLNFIVNDLRSMLSQFENDIINLK